MSQENLIPMSERSKSEVKRLKKAMKIALYYNRPFETGGVEKTMYNRGKMLSRLGYDVTYVYNSKSSKIETLEKWSKIGNVVRYDYCKEHFDFAIYDSIHNNKRVSADKYIQVLNGNVIDGNENYKEEIPFDEYVCVSEDCARQFKQKYGKDSVVIPNIIDIEEIKKLSKEKYDLPKKKYNFVIVSRIDEQKGFDKLDYICKQIEENTKDYQIVVVGSNYNYQSYVNKIQNQLKKYNIVWVGYQENPYKYIANADCLLHLAKYESQCMVMYESLILGVPCVITDFDNAKKEITKDRGCLIDRETYKIDFEAICKLKKGFEYKYTIDIENLWKKVLKPLQKRDYKFSIIIPNYNNAKYLEKCLNSVLNQTYKNYEIIFIDDMSTDNSLDIANKMLKEHKIISLKQKRLNGGSRNVGILEATGDYIICLDSDDWLKHNKVLEMLNQKIRNEDVIFTGFDLYNGEKEGLFPFIPKYKTLDDAFINDVCAIWTKVIKTSILKSTLFPEGTLAEDRVHHYRVVDKCNKFLCIEGSTHVWNRSNKTSVTTDRNYEWEASCIKHLGEMHKYIKTSTYEDRVKYVKNKYDRMIKFIEKGDFKQL